MSSFPGQGVVEIDPFPESTRSELRTISDDADAITEIKGLLVDLLRVVRVSKRGHRDRAVQSRRLRWALTDGLKNRSDYFEVILGTARETLAFTPDNSMDRIPRGSKNPDREMVKKLIEKLEQLIEIKELVRGAFRKAEKLSNRTVHHKKQSILDDLSVALENPADYVAVQKMAARVLGDIPANGTRNMVAARAAIDELRKEAGEFFNNAS